MLPLPWRRAALVVNTRSRSGERAYREALDRLHGLGVPVEYDCPVDDAGRLEEAVRHALAGEPDLLVFGGGDGSVSTAVDALAGGGTALGLLPLGTANDFARTLGIPTDIAAACEVIARGAVVDVDLGFVGEDAYVNVASVGLSVEVTRRLSPAAKRWFGAFAYPLAAVGALVRSVPFAARLHFPDGDHPDASLDRVLQVAVGNGRFYGGGLAVAPDAGIDDRSLDVYVVEAGAPSTLLNVLRRLRSGTFIELDGVHHFRTQRLRLETEPALPINVDGELGARTPASFSLAPNALHVVVPRGSTAAKRDSA